MWSWILDLFSWEMPREPEYFSRERMTKTPAQILEEQENFILELQEEKEKREQYEIVLWWGLDGLKLNNDGTSEWISRRKHQPKPDQVLTFEFTLPTATSRGKVRSFVQNYSDICEQKPQLTYFEQKHEEQRQRTNREFEQAIRMMDAYLENQKRNSENTTSVYCDISPTNASWSDMSVQNYGTINLASAANNTIYSSTVTNCCYSPCLSAKIER